METNDKYGPLDATGLPLDCPSDIEMARINGRPISVYFERLPDAPRSSKRNRMRLPDEPRATLRYQILQE